MRHTPRHSAVRRSHVSGRSSGDGPSAPPAPDGASEPAVPPGSAGAPAPPPGSLAAPASSPEDGRAPPTRDGAVGHGGAGPLIDHLAVLACLYLAGAAVGAAALLSLPRQGTARPWLWVLVAVAALVGAALGLARHRNQSLRRGTQAGLVALGTTLVTVGAYAAGPEGAAAVAVLYVVPATYAAGALPRRWALVLIAYGGAALGVVVLMLEPPWAVAGWVLVTGTAVMVGIFVSKLARQARARLRVERDLSAALEEADAARTTLLRAARHDLGTPLTAVVGLLETIRIRMGELPVETQRELLDRAVSNAQRVARIVDDVADHVGASRGQLQLQREVVDVAALVRGIADSLEVGDHALEVDAEAVTASVDPDRVERIVQNLLVNAVAHTPGDTAITVRVRAERGGVRVVVEDTGPGIPDARKEAVFEPFERGTTGEDQASGSGLGLAVVRQFARAHGGDAWVEDRPGGGARFVVRLLDDG